MTPIDTTGRLNALLSLSSRLAGDDALGALSAALEVLLATTPAHTVTAFSCRDGVEQVADVGLPVPPKDPERRKRALSQLAEQALAQQRSLLLDLERERFSIPELDELSGMTTALVMPVVHQETPLGAYVLLFDAHAELGRDLIDFVKTVTRIVAIAVDRERRIEAERAQQAQREETHKMASLGLMMSRVAHELRGPAGALLLQLEELQQLVSHMELLGDPSDSALGGAIAELAELASDVESATRSIRDTVNQLSELGRGTVKPESLDLSDVVRDALAIARPHLERRGIGLVERLNPDCYVFGRRDQVSQLVLNLVFNAADACEAVSTQRPQVEVHTLITSAQVGLIVEDTGLGVSSLAGSALSAPTAGAVSGTEALHPSPPAVMAKCKDRRGQSTGSAPMNGSSPPSSLSSGAPPMHQVNSVNLAVRLCADAVAALGGRLEAGDRAGGGSSYRVLLPRASDRSGVHAVVKPRPAAPQEELEGLRKILVIDDDSLFTRTLRRALKPHDVRVSASASEAEILLLDERYEPDAVLCDIFLPGNNGHILHQRIKQLRPQIASRFVFITGGGLNRDEAAYLRNSHCQTLFKPLNLRSIVQALKSSAHAAAPFESTAENAERPDHQTFRAGRAR